jgi:hypothetical protein
MAWVNAALPGTGIWASQLAGTPERPIIGM